MKQKIQYYIKYLWYLVKLLGWKLKPILSAVFRFFTPKRLVGTVIAVAALVALWFSFPVIKKYIETPRPPSLHQAATGSPFLYTASTNGNKTQVAFSALIGDSVTNKPTVDVSFGGTATASFVLTNLNPTLNKPTKEGNKLIFSNVRNQVDLSYEPLPNGIKENIIVKQPMEGNAFTFDLNAPGAIAKKNPIISYSPIFIDQNGRYLFQFIKPFAVDAKGERLDNVLLSVIPVDISTSTYKISIVVNQKWLNDPARVYPVSIDPTIVYSTTANFSPGQYNRLVDTNTLRTYISGASGGTIATSSGYTTHTFTAGGTFTPLSSGLVDVLVVGGGGAGGNGVNNMCQGGGGGGGGGVVYKTSYSVTTTPISVTVGGAGQNSVFSGITTASGGGAGGSASTSGNGGNGGSGGGSMSLETTAGNGTSGQGNNGGIGYGYYAVGPYAPTCVAGGGGGGAGAVGNNAVDANTPGVYASGISNSITSSSIEYGRGGAGGTSTGAAAGAAGAGYGWGGGGGGGNGSGAAGAGGAGGAGVVIIRYLTPSSTANLSTYYQELPADINTVGLWHMNESSGTTTVTDSSGNGNTGTSNSSTNVGLGKFVNARTFDGSSTYVSATVSQVNIGSGGYNTIEFWMNWNGATGVMPFSFYNGGGVYDLYLGSSTCFGFNTGAGDTYGTTSSIPTNTWVHVAAVFYNGTYTGYNQLYINGVAQKLSQCLGSAQSGTARTGVYIGDYGGGSYFFGGSIDEVRISNVARSAEEIKMDASRRPYSVYTSDVMDLNSYVSSWSPLTWTELGVNTGDGETLSNSTNLVAQWNFNSTSGTTASKDAGSCGTTTCDLTLTNFASTGSQDAAAGSGWTANNKRWGAGALMFDGTNDYATCTNANCGGTSKLDMSTSATAYSWGAWVKTSGPIPTVSTDDIISKRGAAGTAGYDLGFTPTGYAQCKISDGTNGAQPMSLNTINDGSWHYIVCTNDGTNLNIYVDGSLNASAADSTVTGSITNSNNFSIGWNLAGYYFPGVIDDVAIFSRAMTANEILSNYQAGDLEVQTRVGNTTDPNDGTWEAWKPTTGEAQLLSFDSDASNWSWDNSATYTPESTSNESNVIMEGSGSLKFQVGAPQSDANTVGLWHLEETSGSGAYLKDSSGNSNDGTPGGTTLTDGFFGKGRNVNGSSITVNDSISLKPSNITIESWVKTTFATDQLIIYKYNGNSPYQGYGLEIGGGSWSGSLGCWVGSGLWTIGTSAVNDGNWHHLACTYDGTNVRVYVDGALQSTQAQTAVLSYAVNLSIGYGGTSTIIDEVRISNIARSAEQIAETYRAGRDHYVNRTISSTDLSAVTSLPFYVAADRQGTYMSATIGESAYANYQPDANTVGLWHLDENTTITVPEASGGTVTYSGGNEIHTFTSSGTFTPAVTGNVQVLVVGGGGGGGGGNGTNVNAAGGGGGQVVNNSSVPVTYGASYPVVVGTGGAGNASTNGGSGLSSTFNTSTVVASGGNGGTISGGYNVGGTSGSGKAGGTHNGTAAGGGGGDSAVGANAPNSTTGGAGGAGTANSISGGSVTYGGGGGGGSSTTGGAGGAGGGGAGTATTGNPGTDGLGGGGGGSNTPTYNGGKGGNGVVIVSVPLAGPTGSVKDASGNSNNGTLYGTTPIQGKIGKARSFNGTSDYISVPDNANLQLATGLTGSTWVNTTSSAGSVIFRKDTASGTRYLYGIDLETTGKASAEYYNGTDFKVTSANVINDGNWHHAAMTISGTTLTLYIDGVSQGITTITGTQGVPNGELDIGAAPPYVGSNPRANFLTGTIDEVRVDNVARTADQIRQAYEIGTRTHNITIDFKAALNSGNLIANTSDLSFTIDATAYGATNMGSNLYLGDKIIVEENVNGTNYIAQGTVNSLNISTGAVSVAAWDSGSTVPAGGFSTNATVFKWQREYFDIRRSLSTQRDAITNVTLRFTDGSQGANVWLDDLRSTSGYLSTPGGSTITSSTGDEYLQYRVVQTSFDPAVSSSVTSASITSAVPLLKPTIAAPTALSTTSIQWNFTDNSSDEQGFKVFDTGNNLVATCGTANISSCTETGLSPNTQYTRKVAAYNGTSTGAYSGTTSMYTLAAVPIAPTVVTRTSTTAQFSLSAGTNPAGTLLAIYKEPGATCDGTGGSYIAADGSDNGATPVWQTATTWGTVTASGLTQEQTYSYCVKAKNGNNVLTALGAGNSDAGYGNLPIAGNATITKTTNCLSDYIDGSDTSRKVCGVDAPGATNTALLKLQSGALTVLSNETIVVGSLNLKGGSVYLSKGGSKVIVGQHIWVLDANGDGYPDNANVYVGVNPPSVPATGWKQKDQMTSMTIYH